MFVDIVHGDIKPDNVLIFQNAGGIIYAKVADFGYIALFVEDDEILKIPMTQPWVDPNWDPLGHTFEEAVNMDIFSLGLVCLYIVFTSELECLISTSSTISKSDAIRNLLFQWKNEDSIHWNVDRLLESSSDIDPSDRSLLRKFFDQTLSRSQKKRANKVAELLKLLFSLKLLGSLNSSDSMTPQDLGLDLHTISGEKELRRTAIQHAEFSVGSLIVIRNM
jgi:serine/threonine protein kinase